MTIQGVDSECARLEWRPRNREFHARPVHGDTAQEFGIEVGGFLRHDIVAVAISTTFSTSTGLSRKETSRAAGVYRSDGCKWLSRS